MRAQEAWAIADEWLKSEWLPRVEAQGKAQGFVGAYIMGSLAALPAEAEFNHRASDIDVALVVDQVVLPADRDLYPHGKVALFRECVVQEIFVPATVLDSEETLFTMLGLGCNLRNGRILSDASGRIQRAKDAVAESWAAPEWTTRRLERARTFAAGAVEEMADKSDPIARLGALCKAVTNLAGLPAMATRETPTHRRCLAKAAVIMRARGREELYERMLAVMGVQAATLGDVEAVLADALVALEMEQRYSDTTADLSPELLAALPEATSAGILDLVDDGWVREALLPALRYLAESSANVVRASSAADEAALQKLAAAGLERVGISVDDWPNRVRLAQELLEDLGQWGAGLASAT